jgi:hypothetical protein
MEEDSTLSVRGRLLSTAFLLLCFSASREVEQTKNLASAFKVVDQLIYVCDVGHSGLNDIFWGFHPYSFSTSHLACVLITTLMIRISRFCFSRFPSQCTTLGPAIGRASLPASRVQRSMLRRLSGSFALPCDTTLGPVIGRASLPASQV